MKQGEEYIVENKERHEKSVFKIIVLEATKTTIYFQIEDGDRKRLLTGDFERHYRVIEKIEQEELIPMECEKKQAVALLNEGEIGILESLSSYFLKGTYVSLSEEGKQKLLSIIEKLKTQP